MLFGAPGGFSVDCWEDPGHGHQGESAVLIKNEQNLLRFQDSESEQELLEQASESEQDV